MENQDKTTESKLGKNWKTVALVAAVLMVGAVMGHSLLTSEPADSDATPAKSACQTCPAKASCASQDTAQAGTEAVFATQTEGSCCAKKAAASEVSSESGCCAKKASGCCDTAQAKPGCGGGCSSSTDSL
jgi:hypothetical protein